MDYLADFTTRAATACGGTYRSHTEEGMGWVVRRQWLRLLEPAVLGNGLRFTTWISDIKRVTVLRHFTIQRRDTGAFIGQAHTLWVCVDPDSGRPARIPESFRRDFAPQTAYSG
jgi:acyl-CoA thioester hydrolase